MAAEVRPRGKPAEMGLLNIHSAMLPSECVCFYPQVNALLSIYQTIVLRVVSVLGGAVDVIKAVRHSKLTG